MTHIRLKQTPLALSLISCLILLAVLLGFRASEAETETSAETIRVLLVDGQNNHDWKRTTEELVKALDRIGGFEVTISTSPEKDEWEDWKLDFSEHDVVLNNYFGDPWPDSISEGLLDFLENGGGMVNVHAANNSFPNWPEFNEMTGLLWRDAMGGDRIYIDDATGEQVRVGRGEGSGAGHGRKHPFIVKTRAADHPIMKDFPEEWLHGFDELYHAQRGPGKNMTILNSAYADPETGGSGKHEPMTWEIPYGEGRVVTTVLGHLWDGQKELDALQCIGFQTLLARCLQHAAGEPVTLPIPENFPTKDEVSLAN